MAEDSDGGPGVDNMKTPPSPIWSKIHTALKSELPKAELCLIAHRETNDQITPASFYLNLLRQIPRPTVILGEDAQVKLLAFALEKVAPGSQEAIEAVLCLANHIPTVPDAVIPAITAIAKASPAALEYVGARIRLRQRMTDPSVRFTPLMVPLLKELGGNEAFRVLDAHLNSALVVLKTSWSVTADPESNVTLLMTTICGTSGITPEQKLGAINEVQGVIRELSGQSKIVPAQGILATAQVLLTAVTKEGVQAAGTDAKVIPGSISMRALEFANAIPDSDERFQAIFEITLNATPNDGTSPTQPRDKIIAALAPGGPLARAQELIYQTNSLKAARLDQYNNTESKIHEKGVEALTLIKEAYGATRYSTEPEQRLKPDSREVLNLRCDFMAIHAVIMLEYHLFAFKFEDGDDNATTISKDKAQTIILEALAHIAKDKSMNSLVMECATSYSVTTKGAENLDRKLDALMTILKNNPGTRQYEDVPETLSGQLESCDSKHATKFVELITEFGGKPAVKALADVITSDATARFDKATVYKIIESLGKTGHADPVTAIRALKTLEDWKGYGGNALQALSMININLTKPNKQPFDTSQELAEVVKHLIADEGISPRGVKKVVNAITDSDMRSTEQLVFLAMRKMKPRGFAGIQWHPLDNKRYGAVVKAIGNATIAHDGSVTAISRFERVRAKA